MSCSLKSTISPVSAFLSSPKSNSSFQFFASSSYLRTISEVKGQPALERKPSSGPMCLSRSSASAYATSKVRPAGDLPKEKPQGAVAASPPAAALPVQV